MVETYKGWIISIEKDYKELNKLNLHIYNEKLGVGFRSQRTAIHTRNIQVKEIESFLFRRRETTRDYTDYDEDTTIEEMKTDAYAIVDCFDLMKQSIIDKTQVREVHTGFIKIDIKQDLNKEAIKGWFNYENWSN